jgi:hypothetical protein
MASFNHVFDVNLIAQQPLQTTGHEKRREVEAATSILSFRILTAPRS